jgi:MalT-like TPR region
VTAAVRAVAGLITGTQIDRSGIPPAYGGDTGAGQLGWGSGPSSVEPAGGAAASNLINVPALTTLVRSFVAQYQGDAEATVAFATQTLAEIKPGERLLSANAHVFLAVAEWLRGRLTEAERGIAASVTGWRETGQLTVAAWGYYSLVLIQRAQGRLDAAVATCEQALDTLVTAGWPAPAAGLGYVGLAEIA